MLDYGQLHKLLGLCSPFKGKIENVILDESWIMEEKYDGDRVALYVDNESTLTFGRRGGIVVPPLLRRYNWSGLTAILDGELLGDRYMIFDVLMVNNQSLLTLSLRDRKRILSILSPLFNDAVQLTPFATTDDEKLALLRSSMEEGKEGVIVKDYDRSYLSGRHKSWQKVKFYKTLDAIILELGVLDRGVFKPEAARLGLYDAVDDIGGVKIPMKYQQQHDLKVGDVVEIRYLYVTRDKKLYQPVYLRRRLDKAPSECIMSQMSEAVFSLE